MEDIDRTFLKLKKPDFSQMREIVDMIAKQNTMFIVNPITFNMELARQYHPLIESYCWTVEEFNRELNQVPYEY